MTKISLVIKDKNGHNLMYVSIALPVYHGHWGIQTLAVWQFICLSIAFTTQLTHKIETINTNNKTN
jgi:hypothetical protein